MLGSKKETLELLKSLWKAIIAIIWFSGRDQPGVIVTEHVNKCKCIKQTSNFMCNKTPKHALKSWFGIFLYLTLSWIHIEKNKCLQEVFGHLYCLNSIRTGLGLKLNMENHSFTSKEFYMEYDYLIFLKYLVFQTKYFKWKT